MTSRKNVIVCDNGTGFVKVGFAGEHFPVAMFPSMVGRPTMRYAEKIGGVEIKDIMVGDEAAAVRQQLEINYPLDKGIIRNWEDMGHVWDYTFGEKLKVDTKGAKIVLTEAARNPKGNREQMVQVMFEKYGFQGVQVRTQALLCLYAQGLQTGVVVDSGDGVTHVVPVYEGFVLEDQIKRLDVGGRNVTKHFIDLLMRQGYAFNATSDFDTVRQLKEALGYVSYDPAIDKKLGQETTVLMKDYELPDGRTIKVGAERYEAAECLFNPSLIGIEGCPGSGAGGIADTVFQCIDACPPDTKLKLYESIVLSGGSTMFPGLPSRLEKDIKERYLAKTLGGDVSRLKKFKIKIEDPPRRKHLVWIGGAVIADLMKNTESWWVTKQI